MRFIFPLLLGLIISPLTLAAGPAKVATLERSLWPQALTSAAAFDRASAAEILTFARLLNATPLSSAEEIKAFTDVDKPEMASVELWLAKTRQRLLTNYAQACGQCAASASWATLITASQQPVADGYQQWASASEAFQLRYLYEQVRLAALFPRITSEIETVHDHEVNGFELPDRQFLLSYDDGPAPDRLQDGLKVNGTEQLVKALESAGMRAQFFVLGERIKQQKAPQDFYASQCLGSHGEVHKSHQKWQGWADSISTTRTRLHAYQPGPYWFRPPYGQRSEALTTALQQADEGVMLWNIDSQDWNRSLSDKDVEDRVITLMLLWRRGIILYHDIHPRALANLAALQTLQQQTGLNWRDCRSLRPQTADRATPQNTGTKP
ncbi:MAG: polysaccharide deacetylase family protein [Saccharospirillaceae bacterium]|nr:polysaccharide deacetylase family protein [Saccharospirillaceae bacterium]MCD8530476.1 polysaccharide deacetylase family protein [Saccharospirillaceae bacterium]